MTVKTNDVRSDIYPSISPGKVKKLFYSKYFRKLYYADDLCRHTYNQFIYKIATHCRLQRLNAKGIYTILHRWSTRHDITPNSWWLRNVVIPGVIEHLKETLRLQKKAEKDRAKARKRGGRVTQ